MVELESAQVDFLFLNSGRTYLKTNPLITAILSVHLFTKRKWNQ
jgi:hypothetical protein